MSMKLQEEGKNKKSICPSEMELVNGSLVKAFSNTFCTWDDYKDGVLCKIVMDDSKYSCKW